MNYKKSQFNYVVKKEYGVLIYNTLYNSLTRMNYDEFLQFNKMSMCSEEIKKNLIAQGLWVEENIDELQLYNTYVKLASKYYSAKPNITVTPTMECNARCFYCYEENVRCGKMHDEDATKIIDFIKKLDVSRGVNITWFGGEPLLNQEWMDSFANSLKAEGIGFMGFMISNGSKIDNEVIKKMKENWNIYSVQITFDGSCDEYAKRKKYLDQDYNRIYYEMLQKVKLLSRSDIAVQIRLNIDKKNVESILEAACDIQQLFADNENVTYYPAFLTGSCDEDKLNEKEKIEIVKRLILQDNSNKLPVNNYLYKIPKTSACFYNQKGAFSIDVSGNVFICERKLGHNEYAVGNINNKIDILDDNRELSGKRSECQNCIFLTKCLGGCNDAYENGEKSCFIDKYIIKAYLDIL